MGIELLLELRTVNSTTHLRQFGQTDYQRSVKRKKKKTLTMT